MKSINILLPLLFLSKMAIGQPEHFDQNFGNQGILELQLSNCRLKPYYLTNSPLENRQGKLLTIFTGKRVFIAHQQMAPDDIDIVLVRLTGLGKLDTSFAHTGFKRIAFPGIQGAHTIVSNVDGSIVVAGTTKQTTANSKFFLAKFNFNGLPDNTFGVNGVKEITIPGAGLQIQSLVRSTPNGLPSFGYNFLAASPTKNLVAGLTLSGELRMEFGQNGWLELESGFQSVSIPTEYSDNIRLSGTQLVNQKNRFRTLTVNIESGQIISNHFSGFELSNQTLLGKYAYSQNEIDCSYFGKAIGGKFDFQIYTADRFIFDSISLSPTSVVSNSMDHFMGFVPFQQGYGNGMAGILLQSQTIDSTGYFTAFDTRGSIRTELFNNGRFYFQSQVDRLTYTPFSFASENFLYLIGENQDGKISIGKSIIRYPVFSGGPDWYRFQFPEKQNLIYSPGERYSIFNSFFNMVLTSDSGLVYFCDMITVQNQAALSISRVRFPTNCAIRTQVSLSPVFDLGGFRIFGTSCGFAFQSTNKLYGSHNSNFYQPIQLGNGNFNLNHGFGFVGATHQAFLMASNGYFFYPTGNQLLPQQIPIPAGPLNRFCFNSTNKTILVGDGGKIMRTQNGSYNNVEQLPSPVTRNLNSAVLYVNEFPSQLEATPMVMVGDSGTLILGRGNASHLQVVPVPTRQNIRSVAASSKAFVAVGDSGLLLISYNKGQTWNRRFLGTTARLNQVISSGEFYEFFILADSGILFRTTTAGGMISENKEMLAGEEPIRVFPNPATDEVRFLSSDEVTFLNIYDGNGRKIKGISNPPTTVSIKDFPKGLYLFQFQSVDKCSTIRVMKE